jgi:hypothetical protein
MHFRPIVDLSEIFTDVRAQNYKPLKFTTCWQWHTICLLKPKAGSQEADVQRRVTRITAPKGSVAKQIGLAAAVVALSTATHTTRADATVLYLASPDYSQTSFQSSPNGEEEASPFVVTQTSTVTSITWWGDYFQNNIGADSFTFGFYTGSGSPNNTAIATTSATSLSRTDLGFTGARGDEEYQYTANLAADFTATGSTQYYLAILNAPSSWDWQFDGGGTNFFRFGGDGTDWSTSFFPEQDAFQLNGSANAVPEPGTFTLLGAGLFGLGVLSRRRRARSES